MSDLTPEIVDEVVAACKAGADEAAEALGRALDGKFAVSVGEPGTVDLEALPEDLSGAGLAVVLMVGGTGALVLLPESSQLIPPWYASPDPTGESKLCTLAQELGMLLLPERFMPEDFRAARVKNLAGAIRRGKVSDGAGIVPLELSAEGKKGTAALIWPAPNPAAVTGSSSAAAQSESAPEKKPAAVSKPAPKPTPKPRPEPKPKRNTRLKDLPGYTRSLLRIKVPVVVTLAEKRQPLGRIVELGPGSIIQFEKSCEEMLELDVGSHPIATGEAVKVGDKFGLRINSIVLPEERFKTVQAPQK